MSFTTLEYSVTDGIARIVLNRPDRLNAINQAMSLELPRVWQRFETDPEARVAIFTGAGQRALCTGADLLEPPETDTAQSIDSIRWTPLQNQVSKPVICAVNGMAVGGGLHFVADADIVIAADNAWFSDPHVAVGFVSGLEPVMLARRIPLGHVLRMALMGGAERVSAVLAERMGLVSEVVPADGLQARALELASAIARHSPAALARTKQAIWQSLDKGLQASLENAWQLIIGHTQHPDFSEGPRAFAEKRPPQWKKPGQK
ncbi:MAG: enoyl-CoA hydratase/isomerase family protein [Proteobacteria bacterium]|nr:enoyl-CoA hydratase/isomerase family protein [Pseudomonadota bacterium]HQR02777.1 enoyl-CoA hydratase/isomerase family protein [Rhodocyclaceae bacterium]